MYGQGGGFNPQFRHASPLPPPPPLSQQPLPPPPPPQPQAGVTGGFHQQALPPPPPLPQYQQPPAMRPPPGPYQHGMPPHQNQAYPYAHPGQMHHMPMLPQHYGHMPMPGPPPQAMYQQYPMPGSLPPPPPRPPSMAPENLPPPPPLPSPPPPPSSPPLMPPSPPAAPATAESAAEPEGNEGAPDGGSDGKSEEAANDIIVSDDSDMDMDGDEDSPSRAHLSIANPSPVAAAECSGDINAVNVTKAGNDMSSLVSDVPPGSTGKSKTGNVTVEAGSQLQLIQQGYASDDSEDEEHTGASSNLLLLPGDNEQSQPSDRNTEIGHQQVTNAEENLSAVQNTEPTTHQLKDESSPIKHSSDELGHPVKESLSGSESVGMQQSERNGRIQKKRTRNQSPQARRSCSPSGENKLSPFQSSSPGMKSRSPLAKRTNLQHSQSPHQESLLPGQPLLATTELPQMQFQPNAMPLANDFLQNQIRSYPAQDLSHPRPLDFHPHTVQPVVPSQEQPAAFHSDEFKRSFSLDSAPAPLPDGRPAFSGGVGLSYSSHQSSYGQQQPPPGSLASGGNIVYPSFQIFPSNLPGSSDLGPVSVSDAVLPKSSIKPHYNPFASTFETDPTLDIGPVLSPNAVESASAKAVEHINTLAPFGQPVPGSGTHFNESSAEVVPSRQKQSYPGFASRGAYDPLLDSIEPSSNSINKMDLGQEANLSATGSRNAPKIVNIEVESKNMHGLGLVAESEVGEGGEVAADTETGVVENVSPEALGAKDWSSDIPGDIDNDQSLDASKKSKDSRSMKLFKVAVADFVKEVLKPSWRQGNMSREAYKMIVKKTVDKVSSAVPSNHIPKTPAKIRLYVQSSQRKVTKLVMGYVDKYVKL